MINQNIMNNQKKKLEGKVAVITGASGSIGSAVSLKFAEEGATIIGISRDKKLLLRLDDKIKIISNRNMIIVNEDLTKPEMIETIGQAIQNRFGKIDILVSTAAITGNLSPVSHITDNDWNSVFAINLLSNFNLLKTFDKLFRHSKKAHLIFTTCRQSSLPKPFWGAYGASKAALEQLVKIYAKEMEDTTVFTNLIDPGPVSSKLRRNVFPGENPELLSNAIDIVDHYLELAQDSCKRNGELIIVKK